jgi:hypothetical protein
MPAKFWKSVTLNGTIEMTRKRTLKPARLIAKNVSHNPKWKKEESLKHLKRKEN